MGVQVLAGSDFHRNLSALCPAEASLRQDVFGSEDFGANFTRPLAVRPVPGRAIFFWQEVVGGSDPLLDVFHAGCPVRRGEKLSLQKFKNFAKDTLGCEVSRWCKKFF